MSEECEKIYIEEPMTIEELQELIDENYYGKPIWIDPKKIVGIDYEQIRENIRNNPDFYNNEPEKINYGFEVSHVVLDEYCSTMNYIDNKKCLPQLQKDLPELFKKASYIAKNLYSFSPAYSLPYTKELVTKENVRELLEIAKKEYDEANECKRVFLSVLYLEFFIVIFCFDGFENNPHCISMEYFNSDEQKFIDEI